MTFTFTKVIFQHLFSSITLGYFYSTDLWPLPRANITLLPTLKLNVKHFTLVVYRGVSLQTKDGKPQAQYNMFVWKAFIVVVICSGREEEVRGEGALGGRRREYDQMWAYGHLCGRSRVVCGCESGVRERERLAREILFSFPRGPVVT